MEQIKKLVPGIIFTGILAWICIQIQQIKVISNLHFSSLIIAIIAGILINNLIKIPSLFSKGITFSSKKILRLAIILLGFKLSLLEISQIGGNGIILITIVSTATIFFTVWLGGKFGLERNLALLIGAGSSICGASAVAAVAPVIKAEEKDITFAIATVTIFGTIAMFLYPLLYRFLQIPDFIYAVWAGSSIHEVGQVVAAGFAAGDQVGKFATLIKLTRVLLVIPAAIILGVTQIQHEKRNSQGFSKLAIPWFVFGFLAVVIINSVNIIPGNITNSFIVIDSFLLTVAMAGLGLETNLDKMRKVGMQPFYVGLIVSIFIAVFSFILSNILYI